MTTMKSLAVVALLVGGTSLAMAQNGPPAGGQPPAGGPNPNMQSAAPPPTSAATPRTRTAHRAPHARIYMQARHMIPGCTVGMQASATCACGTGASGSPLLCQPGQWCHYPFAQACTQ
jgi:hypothetical protein